MQGLGGSAIAAAPKDVCDYLMTSRGTGRATRRDKKLPKRAASPLVRQAIGHVTGPALLRGTAKRRIPARFDYVLQ